MRITQVITALFLLGVPALGFAATSLDDTVRDLPEPETLALLAIGAMGWAITRWTKRK